MLNILAESMIHLEEFVLEGKIVVVRIDYRIRIVYLKCVRSMSDKGGCLGFKRTPNHKML